MNVVYVSVIDVIKRKASPTKPTVPTSVVPVEENQTPATKKMLLEKDSVVLNKCAGYHLQFPAGLSPHSNYPFSLHDTQNLPWNYTVSNGVMTLYSVGCKTEVAKGSICIPCQDLKESNILKGISKRIDEGKISDRLPYAYRSMAQLQASLKHKDGVIDFFCLRGLNQARSLLVHSRSLAEHKRFMVAIASGKDVNISRLIGIGLRQNRSIAAITQSYHAAAKGMYQPKSYTEEEDMKGLLLFKLGGSRVAGIAHRAMGLPSVSTLRSRVVMPALIPSHAQPTAMEVMKNIESCFEVIQDMLDQKNVVHQVAMFDEIAMEKRLRWDEKTNFFLGVCREHGKQTSLEFNGMEDMEELFGCMERKEIHIAAEVRI